MLNWQLMRNPINWINVLAFAIFWAVVVWIIGNAMHESAKAQQLVQPQKTGNYT